MLTLPALAAEALGSFLAADIKDRFGSSHARLAELIPFAARLALECIGNSDALYHNVEHTENSQGQIRSSEDVRRMTALTPQGGHGNLVSGFQIARMLICPRSQHASTSHDPPDSRSSMAVSSNFTQ